ncbi:MAG: ATP-binding protein [Firmicutes bacterium]|nr:ATP-binding protein [Bacillota bacterium]
MRLVSFRVQNFRSVLDSGWVACQNITAIAGVNEAGKSNIMRALWKLKPAFRQDNKILHSDIPRDRFDSILESDELPVFISAKFKLEPKDLGALRKFFPTVKPFDTVIVSRTLNGKYMVEVPVSVSGEEAQKLHDFVIRILPGFIYYSNYGNLDSNIYLPQMLNKFNKAGVNAASLAKRRTIKLLLMYAGITTEMLQEDLPALSADASNLTAAQLSKLAETKETYKKKFAEAGVKLSADFNKWWSQGNYRFEIVFEGENLKIWVTDSLGNRAPLEERSVGMQWFLSFFLVFSLESEFFYSNTILLLDESGMTLHSLAQQDLVRFFEKLSKNNQLVYTTHSSFMLPAEHLNRTKVVYRDKFGHSIVADSLRVNAEHSNEASLFPVHSSVSMEVSRSILSGCTPVIVVHNADQYLLSGIKNYLSGKGKYRGFNELVFVATGVNGIEGTAQVLSNNSDLPNVFLSSDYDGRQLKKVLANGVYKADSEYLISVSDFGNFITLEDTLPLSLILSAAGTYITKLVGAAFEFDPSETYIKQIQEYAYKNNIELPGNFREEIAKRIKLFMMRQYDRVSVPRKCRKAWEAILNKLTYC